MSFERKMRCDEHGEHPWSGDVVCAIDAGGCGAVYQTHDEKAAHFAPEVCACSKRLIPDSSDKRKPFTARAICHTCFVARAAVTSPAE